LRLERWTGFSKLEVRLWPQNVYRTLTPDSGLDMFDREEAKRHAKQQAIQALDQSGEY
jgi:hypothetical protein